MKPCRAVLPVAAALAWMGGAGGCSSDLPAASFIDKLRVLAVRAQPPELAPGETTALDLLAVEPLLQQLDGAASQPLSAVWLACALPAGTLTVQPCGIGGALDGGSGSTPPLCSVDPGAPLCLISINHEGPTRDPLDLATHYTVDAQALGGAAAAQILLTVAVANTSAGAEGCLLDVANNGGRPKDPDHCVISIKRLAISDNRQRTTPPNANPTLADFTATPPGGAPGALDDGSGVWSVAPAKDKTQWTIAADRSDGAAEKKADGTYEVLTVSWFTTAGHLDGGRSIYLPPGCNDPAACPTALPEAGASTSWFAPTLDQASSVVDASGLVDFWAVIRDDRGGVGWRTGSLRQK